MIKHLTNDVRFLSFINEFNVTRNYYYCHDLLEELWMEDRKNYGVLKYLLQIAVMQFKKTNPSEINDRGFKLLLDRSINNFNIYESDLITLGIDVISLKESINLVKNKDSLYEFKINLVT